MPSTCSAITLAEAATLDGTPAGNTGTIVLRSAAFAKTKRDLDKAHSGYKELNLRALKMLAPGGILVTCSCSFT